MSRMSDTDEEFLEGTSSMEETGNRDMNKTFICSLTREETDIKTDEEIQICTVEFSDLSIDCAEERNTPKDISNVERKPSNLFNSMIKISQQDTESECFAKDNCLNFIPIPSNEFESFEISDPNMFQANIDITDCDNFLGETVLKKTNEERKENCINCEKSTQNDEESVQDMIELQNQSSKHPTIVPLKLTNQIVNKNSQIPCCLNRTNDESKLTQLNYKDYEESDEYVTEVVKDKIGIENSHTTSWTSASNNEIEQSTNIFQPSQKPRVEKDSLEVSEDISEQTIEAIEEFYTKQVACPKPSEICEISSNQSSNSLDPQSQTPAIGYNSSSVLEISNSSINTSITVVKHSEVFENSKYQSVIEKRNLLGRSKLKKAQLKDVLDFLDNIIRLVENLEFMNNYLTKRAEAMLKIQQRLQELINIVYEYLVKLQFLPSSVILVDNEHTVGEMDFNVKLFGEEIFGNLKSMKKELNKAFREFNGFRKDFRVIVRKMCLVPFEQTQHHEVQSTLNKTIEIYFKVHRLFSKRERFEVIEDKIASETLGEVSRVKEFGHYLDILNGDLCCEGLI